MAIKGVSGAMTKEEADKAFSKAFEMYNKFMAADIEGKNKMLIEGGYMDAETKQLTEEGIKAQLSGREYMKKFGH